MILLEYQILKSLMLGILLFNRKSTQILQTLKTPVLSESV